MVAELKGRLSLDGKPFVDTLKRVGDDVEKDLGKKIKDVGKAIAAAFTAREILNFAKGALKAADDIDNLSKQVDLSYESVQSLKLVSEEAGVSFDTLRPTINQLRRAVDEARGGNEQFADAFGRLGLSIDELKSMNTEQIFQQVAFAINESGGEADAMTASTKVLGAESTRLLGVIKQVGSEGLDQLNAKFRETNQILSNETVQSLDQAQERVDKFFRQFNANNVTAFSEALRAVENVFTDVFGGGIELTERGAKAVADYMAITAKAENDRIRLKEEQEARLKAQQELLNEIAGLEQKVVEIEREGIPDKQRRQQIMREIADIEKQLSNLSGTGIDNYRDQLKLQIDLNDKKQELEAVSARINKAEADALRDQTQQAEKLDSLRRALGQKQEQHLYNSLDLEGKIEHRKTQQLALQQEINKALDDSGNETEESLRLRSDLFDIERDIEGLLKEQTKKQEEAKSSSVDQLEAVEKLRDIFKVMTEEELDAFVQKLKEIAKELASIDPVNVDWLKVLSGLDLAGLNRTRAENVKDFLRTLAEGIDQLPSIKADAFDFIKALSGLEFGGLNKTRGKNVADFFVAIVDGLKGFQDVNLDQVSKLFDAIGGVTPGKYEVSVMLPDEFKDGFPLIFPDGMEGTLNDINGSLKTLAGLKGVVWA